MNPSHHATASSARGQRAHARLFGSFALARPSRHSLSLVNGCHVARRHPGAICAHNHLRRPAVSLRHVERPGRWFVVESRRSARLPAVPSSTIAAGPSPRRIGRTFSDPSRPIMITRSLPAPFISRATSVAYPDQPAHADRKQFDSSTIVVTVPGETPSAAANSSTRIVSGISPTGVTREIGPGDWEFECLELSIAIDHRLASSPDVVPGRIPVKRRRRNRSESCRVRARNVAVDMRRRAAVAPPRHVRM